MTNFRGKTGAHPTNYKETMHNILKFCESLQGYFKILQILQWQMHQLLNRGLKGRMTDEGCISSDRSSLQPDKLAATTAATLAASKPLPCPPSAVCNMETDARITSSSFRFLFCHFTYYARISGISKLAACSRKLHGQVSHGRYSGCNQIMS